MIEDADQYLNSRTGCYDYRSVRYQAAADVMVSKNLNDGDTVYDIGAGWTEFDYTLRHDYNWKGRYIPVDAGIDGTDLEHWIPPRQAEFAVALEVIEHLEYW